MKSNLSGSGEGTKGETEEMDVGETSWGTFFKHHWWGKREKKKGRKTIEQNMAPYKPGNN